MLDLAVRNIWQRKTRSLLTVVGIGAAVTLYLFLSTIMNFYNRDLQGQLASIAGKVVVSAKSEAANGFPTAASVIPEADAEAVVTQEDLDRSRSTPVLLQPLVTQQSEREGAGPHVRTGPDSLMPDPAAGEANA